MRRIVAAALSMLVALTACGEGRLEAARQQGSSVEKPRAPVPPPDPELLAHAEQSAFRDWLGVYMMGSKVGWMELELRKEDWNGQAVLREDTRTYMHVKVDEDVEESTSAQTVRYALFGDGEIVSVTSVEIENGRKTERVAVRDGDALVVTSRTGDSETERRVRVAHVTLRHEIDVQKWLDDVARRGDRNAATSVWMLDLTDAAGETEAKLRYRGTERRAIGGVPTDVHKVRLTMMGLPAEAELVDWKHILRARAGGVLELRREPESVAKALDDEVPGLFALTGIELRGDLPDVEPSVVVLDAAEFGEFEFPETAHQSVEKTEDGVRITLRSEPAETPAAPLSDAERKRWLAGSVRHPIDDDELIAVVRKLVPDAGAPVRARAEAVFDFVHESLAKSYGKNAEDAAAVLANRGGDCSEHALLFVALARAAGIPARELGGLVPDGGEPCRFVFHAWAEYHDGERWIEVDPTYGQKRLDALHLRLATSDDLSWATLAGKLELELVEAR